MKDSAKELSRYMNFKYGLSNRGIEANWHYNIPKKYKNDIKFIGYVDSNKWREYCRLNNIEEEERVA